MALVAAHQITEYKSIPKITKKLEMKIPEVSGQVNGGLFSYSMGEL
jgi:hypothetical protein